MKIQCCFLFYASLMIKVVKVICSHCKSYTHTHTFKMLSLNPVLLVVCPTIASERSGLFPTYVVGETSLLTAAI